MLTHKTQHQPKSCGAACSLVTRIELGAKIALTDAEEDTIYNSLKEPKGSPLVDEILPNNIVAYMLKNGLTASIIESSNTTLDLLKVRWKANAKLQGLYLFYDQGVTSSKLAKTTKDLDDTDLDNDARLFLVLKFKGKDALHYVLARKGDPPNEKQCYIMNPDPGTDEAINLPKVGGPLKTNLGTPKGVREYIYLGIAVHVKK